MGTDTLLASGIISWPLRIANEEIVELSPDQALVYRVIRYGYTTAQQLSKRCEGTNVEQVVQELEKLRLVRTETGEGPAPTLAVCEDGPRIRSRSDVEAPALVVDAVDNRALPDDLVQYCVEPKRRRRGLALLAPPDWDWSGAKARFCECAVMVFGGSVDRAAAVFVYVDATNRSAQLERCLADLLCDRDPRVLAALPQLGDLRSAMVQCRDVAPARSTATTGEAASPRAEDNVADSTPPLATVPAERVTQVACPVIEVVRGVEAHEEQLHMALRDARDRVIIVTPHLRARARHERFCRAVAEACGRGVVVDIRYGMPPDRDGRDEQPEIEDRVRHLRETVSTDGRLLIENVYQSGSCPNGDHSKVLICDAAWAVVTSFNWLSFPRPADTGVVIRDPGAVRDLLQLFAAPQPRNALAGSVSGGRNSTPQARYYPFNDYSGDLYPRDGG